MRTSTSTITVTACRPTVACAAGSRITTECVRIKGWRTRRRGSGIDPRRSTVAKLPPGRRWESRAGQPSGRPSPRSGWSQKGAFRATSFELDDEAPVRVGKGAYKRWGGRTTGLRVGCSLFPNDVNGQDNENETTTRAASENASLEIPLSGSKNGVHLLVLQLLCPFKCRPSILIPQTQIRPGLQE